MKIPFILTLAFDPPLLDSLKKAWLVKRIGTILTLVSDSPLTRQISKSKSRSDYKGDYNFNLQKMAKKYLIERICVFSKLYLVKILPISLKIALNNQQKYCFCTLTGGFSTVKLGTLSWPLNFSTSKSQFLDKFSK